MSDTIVREYITNYIRNTIYKNDGILKELEIYAKENNVPIIQEEAARFIYTMACIKKPNSILEIGTAIGYSSILLSKSLTENGKIITIERNNNMFNVARQNIEKANLTNTIEVIEGDALEVLSGIKQTFDIIFLDAAKGQYPNFLPYCLKLLNKGGILISDNILYKGMIATDELMVRRKKTIVKRLRQYLDTLCNHEQLETSIIPIGDGIALSYKK